jgi:integrase
MAGPITGLGRKSNFTRRFIESIATPASDRLIVWDTRTSGLGLKIEPSGHRVFFWYRWTRGRPVWRTLGPADDLSVEQARQAAGELNAAIARWKASGYEHPNPLVKPEGFTLDALAEEYIVKHLRGHARRPEEAEARLRWTLEKYTPGLKSRKLGEIRPEDIESLQRKLAAKGHLRTSNSVIKLLRTLFNWGLRNESLRLALRGQNPCAAITYYSQGENKRHRFIEEDELPAFLAAAEAPEDVRDFIRLAFLTAQRRGDILAMKWDQLELDDPNNPRWTIPSTKTGRPHTVPLLPEAVALLKQRRKNRATEYVFPSHSSCGHLTGSGLKRSWAKILETAGLTNGPRPRLVIHDLRRSAGAYLIKQGVPMAVVSRFLGHSSIRVTEAIYTPMNLSTVRSALKGLTDTMEAAKKVVPLALPAAPAAKPKAARAARG